MGDKTLDELQKNVQKAFKPLLDRWKYYENGSKKMHESLAKFFILDAKVAASLIEPAKPHEQMFDFNAVKEKIKSCLDEQILLEQCRLFVAEHPEEKPSLVRAFDAQILQSGLPFVLENGIYHLNFDKAYTPKAENFMQQFTHSLNLFRVYLSIFQTYSYLATHDYLQTDVYMDCLQRTKILKTEYKDDENEENLRGLFWQAKQLKREIKALFKSLNERTSDFEQFFLTYSPYLALYLDDGARRIEATYKAFPNDSRYTFFLWDTTWHSYLKGVAENLFASQYTYHSYTCTLEILPQFSKTLLEEIMTFHSTAIDKQSDYKIALLSDALQNVDEVMNKLRSKASKTGLSFVVPPTQRFFAAEEKEESPTIYHLLYKLMQVNNYNPLKQQDDEDADTILYELGY